MDELFSLAELLEPYQHDGIAILPNKMMATIFFEPSTRTRLSFESAMNRLGGRVLTEATPLISSSIAKDESLDDMLRVVSEYANIIVLRHPDPDVAEKAVKSSMVPVISGGFGDREHPTQALLDLYTIYRTMGKIDFVSVTIAGPDLSKARVGHSLALALARYRAKITLVSPAASATPDYVISSLKNQNADLTQVLDPTLDEYMTVIGSSDIVYLAGCRVPKGDQSRETFRRLNQQYFVPLEALENAKSKGKMVYLMHPLPRFLGEIDPRIDCTPFALYFRQAGCGVVLRMALLLSILS